MLKNTLGRSLRTVLALFICLAAITAAGTAQAADTVKIGAVLPLTGGLAPFGQASLHGIELAVNNINNAGGLKGLDGAELKIVSGDAGGDPTTAASVTQRLVARNRVKAVLGAFSSSLSLAASQVTERSHIPFLTMSFSDELTSRGFHYLFQDVAQASAMGEAQMKYARQIAKAAGEPLKNVAILYENSAYGTSQAKGMKANAKELGVNVTLYESYPHGINDATALIQKIKHAQPKPDAIFPISYFTDAVLIVRALRQNHLDMPIVGGAAGYIIPDFKKALGKDVNGIFSADTSNYDHYGKLGKQYRKRYGQFMTHEAFEHAVLVYAYATAVNHAKTTDPGKVAKALHSLKMTKYPFSGLPGGGIDFNKAGLNTMTHPVMVQWQNGELVTVWPKNEAKGNAHWK